jgi:hypothetical protein
MRKRRGATWRAKARTHLVGGGFRARPVNPRDTRGRNWSAGNLLAQASILGLKLGVLLLRGLQGQLKVANLAAQTRVFGLGTERCWRCDTCRRERSLFEGLFLYGRGSGRLFEAYGVENAPTNHCGGANEQEPPHILALPRLDVWIAAIINGLWDRIGDAHWASSSI